MKYFILSSAAAVAAAALLVITGCQQDTTTTVTPQEQAIVASKAKATTGKTAAFSTLASCSPLMVLKCAGNGNDASGNGYNATALGSPVPTYTGSSYLCNNIPVSIGAVKFNAPNSTNCWYVPTSNTMSWGAGDFTVHVKFKIDALTGVQQTIFVKKDINTSIAAHAIVLIINPLNKLSVFFRETTSAQSVSATASSTILSPGVWYCATVARINGQVSLYLDDVIVASTTYTGSCNSNGAICIGSDRDNPFGDTGPMVYAFKGIVDEVVLWNCGMDGTTISSERICSFLFAEC